MPDRRARFIDLVFNPKRIYSKMVGCHPFSCDSSSKGFSCFSERKIIQLLLACVRLNDILTGEGVHCLVVKTGFSSDAFVGSSLVDLYSKCVLVKEARSVFDSIVSRDLVLWNVMVSCYALNGLARESLSVFKLMRNEGFVGDGFTLSSLLSSCSYLQCNKLGKQIHGLVVRLLSPDLDVVVGSALTDMYVKCGDIEEARRVFDSMNARNVVTWNAIIVGYGQHGEGKKAIKLLHRMIQVGLKPDEITVASVLSSCANWAATSEVVQVHAYLVKNGFQSFISIGNALIIAYAKSGGICSAFKCFCSIPEPDLISWNSMVSSYAFHGLVKEAIEMFERMVHEGVKPNWITFLGILSACSHAGRVETGLQYFGSMRKYYSIEPAMEHYTCLVDLLGRAGHVHEAYSVIRNMPFEPGCDVLGAFISACKVHGNAALAKWAADELFIVETDQSANYSLLSNIFAALGCWDDVGRVRKLMRSECNNKVPGCSWMEIAGVVHVFVSSDNSHPQASYIYFILGLLVRLMKGEDFSSDHPLKTNTT